MLTNVSKVVSLFCLSTHYALLLCSSLTADQCVVHCCAADG